MRGMKIQAIKKACMDTEVFYIFNCQNGRQYISNGAAAWPVEGIQITPDIIPVIFDIDEKKRQKITIHEMDAPDEERFTLEPMQGEEELEDLGLVWHSGTFFRALRGEDGLLFINTALTKPGENKEGKFRYCARKREGRVPLVACYGDMLCSAIVYPAKGRAIMEQIEKISYQPLNVFWDEEEEREG